MKFICKSCKFVDPCVLDIGDDIDLRPDAFACPKKLRNENCKWEELPKLTAEVFDREDCPEWAKFAVVNMHGTGYFYEDEPSYGTENYKGMWYVDTGKIRMMKDAIFNAADWQNSLIKRPEKKTLPDWCKVGEWAYCKGRYKKIEAIDHTRGAIDTGIAGTFIPITECAKARLRPFNADEMKALVGKVIEIQETVFLILYYSKATKTLYFNGFHYTASDLLNDKFTIDGKPCGVLEHFDAEREEWVK